ncbi:5'-3' exonuclease H3TH domain-containing protein [Spongisporangium articulatum]|uniref:5'-3' exonuclease n=1 Tax=Spongisporangium articulatum TaxID=3362603 RepID=A0ABW8AMJ8_9ACTN
MDGNSLLHRAYHAMHSAEPEPGGLHGQRDATGRPVWALRGLVGFLARAAARLTPDAVVIGFDCPETSRRRESYPAYKAHRPDKPEPLVEQLADAPEVLRAAGFSVVCPTGWEADDVLASAAASAAAEGWRTTVVTSDRDSFALIDESTSVLRVLNGGIDGSPVLTPKTLPVVCGVAAGQYRDLAALRGDSSDNLQGAMGIGQKTATKLLEVFPSVDAAYEAIDTGREAEVVAAIGVAATRRLADPLSRENVARNQKLMEMRRDVPVPPLAAMAVPMDKKTLQTALATREIYLGPSLWALVGGTPPAGDHYGAGLYPPAEPGPLGAEPAVIDVRGPSVAAPRRPRHSAEPVTGQLSLF